MRIPSSLPFKLTRGPFQGQSVRIQTPGAPRKLQPAGFLPPREERLRTLDESEEDAPAGITTALETPLPATREVPDMPEVPQVPDLAEGGDSQALPAAIQALFFDPVTVHGLRAVNSSVVNEVFEEFPWLPFVPSRCDGSGPQ